MAHLGLEIRKEILQTSLRVESWTSRFLALFIGIYDLQNSKVLGNKGGALSFSQKVDMLIEIGALSKDERNKFQTFMEIRNQFMHNIDASTYKACFTFMEGKEKYLLKTYSQPEDLEKEDQLRNATLLLAEDVVRMTTDLVNKLNEKLKKIVDDRQIRKNYFLLVESIDEIELHVNDYFDKEIEKGETVKSGDLKNLGTRIKSNLMNLWNIKISNEDNAKTEPSSLL